MKKAGGNHSIALKDAVYLESMSPRSPSASTFAAVLDIVYSNERGGVTLYAQRRKLDRETNENLRLTCKAIRDVVDKHVYNFIFFARDSPLPLNTASSWRWPNVTRASVIDDDEDEDEDEDDFEDLPAMRLHQAFEDLVALPLPKLHRLDIECFSFLPFANANFPMLEMLVIKVMKSSPQRGVDPFSPYPTNLHFPKMPLKDLQLDVEVEDTARLAFLGPLLKSCHQLTRIIITSEDYRCDEQMAEMLHSAPFSQLETLHLYVNACDGFYPKLFNRDYPALKELKIFSPWVGDLSFIASTNWVRRVEDFDIFFSTDSREEQRFGAEEFRCLLKALENGALEIFEVSRLPISVFSESFRGLRLESLKKLTVTWLYKLEGEDVEDVSDHLNVVFDTCLFPKLVSMWIDSNIIYNRESPGWFRPPFTSSAQCIGKDGKFRLFQNLSIHGFKIGRDVMDYLAHIRRQTGCYIDPELGRVEQSFPPHHQLFLERLGVSLDGWCDFCWKNVSRDAYYEEMCWHSMSDVSFKRIAFAVMLENAHNVATLERFINGVEAEETETVMTIEVLDYLKTFLENAEYAESKFELQQTFQWGEMDALIDYKKGLRVETHRTLGARRRRRPGRRFGA